MSMVQEARIGNRAGRLMQEHSLVLLQTGRSPRQGKTATRRPICFMGARDRVRGPVEVTMGQRLLKQHQVMRGVAGKETG